MSYKSATQAARSSCCRCQREYRQPSFIRLEAEGNSRESGLPASDAQWLAVEYLAIRASPRSLACKHPFGLRIACSEADDACRIWMSADRNVPHLGRNVICAIVLPHRDHLQSIPSADHVHSRYVNVQYQFVISLTKVPLNAMRYGPDPHLSACTRPRPQCRTVHCALLFCFCGHLQLVSSPHSKRSPNPKFIGSFSHNTIVALADLLPSLNYIDLTHSDHSKWQCPKIVSSVSIQLAPTRVAPPSPPCCYL